MPGTSPHLEPPHRHADHGRDLSDARDGIHNEILAALPFIARRKVLMRVERVALHRRQVIQECNLPLRHAYFVESGTVSSLARAGDGWTVEVQTLGSKDFVGIPVVLGTGRSPHRCVVQVPGHAVRVSASDLTRLMEEIPELQVLLLGYVQSALTQVGELLACNSRHELKHRLARWLLNAADQLGSAEVSVTHECLSRLLGVRRAGITAAIGRMEQAGHVRGGRGRILIIDRTGLEQESCPCYMSIRNQYHKTFTRLHRPTAHAGLIA